MFNAGEKEHLLKNLDIEVTYRRQQLKDWLRDHLENFTIHQEGLVSRIPKQVRGMKMREFGNKYHGSIQAALRGAQREKFSTVATEIDKSTRKRKWVESQGQDDASTEKVVKNARLASPDKKAGPSTGVGAAQRARMQAAAGSKPSGMMRAFGSPVPSPQKARAPFTSGGQNAPRSPSKLKQTHVPATQSNNSRTRVPSVSSFNPAIPKTTAYPSGTARLPRKHESMLSVNGSPIANPFDLSGDETNETHKRSRSIISVQRDPSFAGSSGTSHSRTVSMYSSTSSSQEGGSTLYPTAHPARPNPHQTQARLQEFRFPPMASQASQPLDPTTPRLKHSRSVSTLPIMLSTTDGHLLEFDALQTSPGAIDALPGISDSAKKNAREEISMLVRAAVDKWSI